MKKLFFSLIATLLFVNLTIGQSLQVVDYYHLGDLHNKALDYTLNKIDEDKEFANIDESVNYVNSLVNDFLTNEKINTNYLIGYESSKYFLLNDEFYIYFNNNSNIYDNVSAQSQNHINVINNLYQIEGGQGAFSSLINNSNLVNITDEYEKNLLFQLSNIYKKNWEGKLNTNDIISEISKLENDFNSKNYNKDGMKGHTTAIVLAISKRSMEWWSKNFPKLRTLYIKGGKGPSNFDEVLVVLPNIVAQDIAGAIVGAVGGAIWSSMNGGFSWSSVGWGAFYTGVMASTGMVGRIAKVIKKI